MFWNITYIQEFYDLRKEVQFLFYNAKERKLKQLLKLRRKLLFIRRVGEFLLKNLAREFL